MKILVPAYGGPFIRTRNMVEVEFRRDPIPGTYKRRGGGYGKTVLRRPRTTQERRAYFHDEVSEYGIRIRGRRSAHHLPNAWDDLVRSDVFDRKSWKRQRKTQWKG